MTSIIQSASEIHELDKTTFFLEQDLLKVTEEERDLYKNAFEVLSAELQKRDTLILTLQHRLYPLTIPANLMNNLKIQLLLYKQWLPLLPT